RKLTSQMKLGKKIKELRESKGLLQRQLSAHLDIDSPMYSKIERGERKAKPEQIQKIAQLLKVDTNELYALWLADRVLDIVKNEKLALQALDIATKEIKENPN